MASDKVQTLDDSNFDATIGDGGLPVVVDFWATWCGPCKMIAPTFEKLAEEFDGKARFAKVDVDKCPSIAGKHGVNAMPTFLVFKDGQVAERIQGAPPPQVLKETLERAIG